MVGSRGAVVVVDADVGAGVVGIVGSATPGARRGGSGWGSRVAEATRAARAVVVSPKTNSSSLQGRRGLARCRGGGVGMVHRPGSAGSSGLLGVPASRPLTGRIGRSCAQRIERYVPASLPSASGVTRRSLYQGNLSLVLAATVRGARGPHIRLISGLTAPSKHDQGSGPRPGRHDPVPTPRGHDRDPTPTLSAAVGDPGPDRRGAGGQRPHGE